MPRVLAIDPGEKRVGVAVSDPSGTIARPLRWIPAQPEATLPERLTMLAREQEAEELIVGLRESVAIVIVTHNLQQALRVADHVAFMHLGELVEYGSSEQVFDRPLDPRTREYVSGVFG